MPMITTAEASEILRMTDRARAQAQHGPNSDTHVYDDYTIVGFMAGQPVPFERIRSESTFNDSRPGAHFFRGVGFLQNYDGLPFFDGAREVMKEMRNE